MLPLARRSCAIEHSSLHHTLGIAVLRFANQHLPSTMFQALVTYSSPGLWLDLHRHAALSDESPAPGGRRRSPGTRPATHLRELTGDNYHENSELPS
jgi:hypothetical protein